VGFAIANHAGPVLSFLQVAVPISISLIALWISPRDRRPRLTLKARKGNWYVLKSVTQGEFIFMGVIEVYNVSSRANAIRGYKILGKREDGDWSEMETERCTVSDPEFGDADTFNRTPLTLAPYSGIEVKVQGIANKPQPYEMQVAIFVEDLFGKQYSLEVKAIS
jgi:hypothetical protein